MIVFYKTCNSKIKRLNSSRSVKPKAPNKIKKKITKSNKTFLQVLGFKT